MTLTLRFVKIVLLEVPMPDRDLIIQPGGKRQGCRTNPCVSAWARCTGHDHQPMRALISLW